MSENDEINLPVDAFEPNRERVTIDVGAFVQRADTVYRVAQVLDFESIIGIAVETGRCTPLAVAELRPVSAVSRRTIRPKLPSVLSSRKNTTTFGTDCALWFLTNGPYHHTTRSTFASAVTAGSGTRNVLVR